MQKNTQKRAVIWRPFTQAMGAPEPLKIKRASGAYLYDESGRAFLDLVSSWWVTIHGHSHPAIVEAIAKQVAQLDHILFADCSHDPAEQLAERLVQRLPEPLSHVFFSDNGSTSVEVALKAAFQYHANRGEQRPLYIAFEGGYHGDTFGAMAVGQRSGFFSTFESLLPQVKFVPYADTWEGDEGVEEREKNALGALEICLEKHHQSTAALIVEPLIQGAGGMRFCRPGFIRQVVELAKRYGVLTIFDEVMTGFGRTGTLLALEQVGATPDFLCLSKGLSGGVLPLSVTLCTQAIYEAFLGKTFQRALAHGHSYTANPIACASGLASLDLFATLWENIQALNEVHSERIRQLSHLPTLHKGRVRGTVAAIDYRGTQSTHVLKKRFLDAGIFLRPLGNTFYCMPPYCVDAQTLHRAYDTMESILSQ